jgi:hypothetical protein
MAEMEMGIDLDQVVTPHRRDVAPYNRRRKITMTIDAIAIQQLATLMQELELLFTDM